MLAPDFTSYFPSDEEELKQYKLSSHSKRSHNHE